MQFRTCEILIIIFLGVIAVRILANVDSYKDIIYDRGSGIGMHKKRSLIKRTAGLLKNVGKHLAKGVVRLSELRRTFRAARILLSGAKHTGRYGNSDRYFKPGGLEQAKQDFALLNPDKVVSYKRFDDKFEDMETLQGRVGDNVVMMVLGDDIMPLVSMWRVMAKERKIIPQISVYYE